MTESDRRLLTEYLGECWHATPVLHKWIPEGRDHQVEGWLCPKCNDYWKDHRTFTTIQDFYDLKCRMVERGEWVGRFLSYAYGKWEDGPAPYDSWENWLISPDRCETVAEWLRGEPQESMFGRVTKDTIIIGR